MRQEIQRWIAQSEEDLINARAMLAAERNAATVFHCQQAVEKVLKAFYMLIRQTDAPRSHSLVFLGHETGTLDTFGDLLRELTPAYTDTRYPDASIESPELIYGGDRAKKLMNQTEKFFQWIRLELDKKSQSS
jgi:HEPN domain-containing protein